MAQIVWTRHAEFKMRQYGLSKQRVTGIIRRPERTEEGIAPRTVAVMQPVSPKQAGDKRVWRQEIWTLYQVRAKRKSRTATESLRTAAKELFVISAWRYPGMSPENSPIPREILQELVSGGIL